MATFVKFFVLMWAAVLAEGITTHSVTECSDRVILNCSITERIHIERITYYNGTDCNQAVTDLQVCGQPLTGSDTGLIPYCSGTVACVVHHNFCPGSKAVKVDYRCIPGSNVKDMCDEFIIDNTNRIFLSTPNFPSSPTFTDISPCRCSIRGSSITSIQILELVLQASTDGTKSSLEINYGDVTYKTESLNDATRRVYNKILSARSTKAEITLNHNGIDYQHLWIEIQGVSIHVSCNTETNEKDFTTSSTSPTLFKTASRPPSSSTTPSSPTSSQSVSEEPDTESSSSTNSSSSTTTASTPQTADIKSHSQDKDTTISVLAVFLSLALLIICITAIIIIVLLRRKKLVCVKKSLQEEREKRKESIRWTRLEELQEMRKKLVWVKKSPQEEREKRKESIRWTRLEELQEMMEPIRN